MRNHCLPLEISEIKKDDYVRIDITKVFLLLLHLHEQKCVILHIKSIAVSSEWKLQFIDVAGIKRRQMKRKVRKGNILSLRIYQYAVSPNYCLNASAV